MRERARQRAAISLQEPSGGLTVGSTCPNFTLPDQDSNDFVLHVRCPSPCVHDDYFGREGFLALLYRTAILLLLQGLRRSRFVSEGLDQCSRT